MALLNFLNELAKEQNFECVAITVDHGLRENSASDAKFVVNYCNKNNIKVYSYKVEAALVQKDRKYIYVYDRAIFLTAPMPFFTAGMARTTSVTAASANM